MSQPHILFHRPTLWENDVQCSTKVLARLSAETGARVTYLQSLLDPIHIAKASTFVGAWRRAPRHEHGVDIVMPFSPIPVRNVPVLRGQTASNLKYRLAQPSLRKLGSPDIIWTTVPGSAVQLRRLFPESQILFHVIDYYPAFSGKAVKSLERADYAVADHVYTIGRALAEYVTDRLEIPACKVSNLGQGVDAEMYRGSFDEPSDIKGLPRPRAVWTGVLGKGDPGLFEAASRAIKAKGGSLILIGPVAQWAKELAAHNPHVKLLGPKPPVQIPDYLRASDIGLLLYDRARADVYRGQNPLKLYEYAAAGLAIISTPHDEYQHLGPPAIVVNDAASSEAAIHSAVPSDDLAHFVRNHDWRTKVQKILSSHFPEWQASQ